MHSERRLILVLGMLAAFGPLSIDMYLPSLPSIGRELGASAAGVQLTLSAFFIGFALGQLLYGPLSDRLGRRPMLVSGLLIYVATSALCALSADIESLVGFRLLHALGGGAGIVVARAMVRDLFGTDRAARVLSMMMLVTAVAPLLAPLAGGYLLAWLGWRSIFWTLTGFGALCLVAVLLWVKETNPAAGRASESLLAVFAGYRAVLGSRAALGCILTGGFAFAGMFAYISGTPFVYIELFGVAPQAYGYLFGLNIVGLMIGSMLNARLVLRFGAVRMMRSGTHLAAAAGLALLASTLAWPDELLGIVLALLFYIGSLNLIAANAIALASQDFPRAAGRVAALFGAMQFGLGAMAGLVVGQLHDGSALPMGATIALCGVLAWSAARLVPRSAARA